MLHTDNRQIVCLGRQENDQKSTSSHRGRVQNVLLVSKTCTKNTFARKRYFFHSGYGWFGLGLGSFPLVSNVMHDIVRVRHNKKGEIYGMILEIECSMFNECEIY